MGIDEINLILNIISAAGVSGIGVDYWLKRGRTRRDELQYAEDWLRGLKTRVRHPKQADARQRPDPRLLPPALLTVINETEAMATYAIAAQDPDHLVHRAFGGNEPWNFMERRTRRLMEQAAASGNHDVVKRLESLIEDNRDTRAKAQVELAKVAGEASEMWINDAIGVIQDARQGKQVTAESVKARFAALKPRLDALLDEFLKAPEPESSLAALFNGASKQK